MSWGENRLIYWYLGNCHSKKKNIDQVTWNSYCFPSFNFVSNLRKTDGIESTSVPMSTLKKKEFIQWNKTIEIIIITTIRMNVWDYKNYEQCMTSVLPGKWGRQEMNNWNYNLQTPVARPKSNQCADSMFLSV